MSTPSAKPHFRLREGGLSPWRTLEALSLYRGAVCVALLALSTSDIRPPYLGAISAVVAEATLYAYLFAAALLLILVRGQRPSASWQVSLQIGVDVLAITCLLYASGGVASGFGTLLMTPVIAGSLILNRQLAILPPALATIAVLGVEAYLSLSLPDHPDNFTNAGTLGAVLFIVAIIGALLAKRTRDSEARVFEAEGNIAKLSQLSESVIHKLQAGVLVIDAQGRIELRNRAAGSLLGAAPFGSALEDIAPPLASRWRQWKSDPTSLPTTATTLPNGNTAWLQFTRLGKGESASTLLVLDDASRVAEQAQAMKLASLGRLTASIAHELRNPLAAIQHAADLLLESAELPASERHLGEIINRQTKRLGQVIDSVLGLSRPRDSSSQEIVRLASLLRDCANDFLHGCEAQCPELSLDIDPPDLQIESDPALLAQVLTNLLDNAQRHARVPDHPLQIRVRAHYSDDKSQIIVDVEDNGPGISDAVADKVFEPFFSTRHEGTGLGLFITRELCEAASGQLKLMPQTKDGALFRLSFPTRILSRAA